MQSNTHAHEYAELRQLLAQQGLFDRQPMYYAGKALQNLSFLVLAVGILVTTNVFWLQMLNAAFLAFVFKSPSWGMTRVTGRCFSLAGRRMSLACCVPC